MPFITSGIIWKQENKDGEGHTVSGLTTAASIWLSAAVGIACSGELYFAATFSVAVMLILLRFGPRTPSDDDTSYGALSSAFDNTGPDFNDDDIEAKIRKDGMNGKDMNQYGATIVGSHSLHREELEALEPLNGIPAPRSPGRRSTHTLYSSTTSLDKMGGKDVA